MSEDLLDEARFARLLWESQEADPYTRRGAQERLGEVAVSEKIWKLLHVVGKLDWPAIEERIICASELSRLLTCYFILEFYKPLEAEEKFLFVDCFFGCVDSSCAACDPIRDQMMAAMADVVRKFHAEPTLDNRDLVMARFWQYWRSDEIHHRASVLLGGLHSGKFPT